MQSFNFFKKDQRSKEQKATDIEQKHLQQFTAKMETLVRCTVTECCEKCPRGKNVTQSQRQQIADVVAELMQNLKAGLHGTTITFMQKRLNSVTNGDVKLFCSVIFYIETSIRELPNGNVKTTLMLIWGKTDYMFRNSAKCKLDHTLDRQSGWQKSPPAYNNICNEKDDEIKTSLFDFSGKFQTLGKGIDNEDYEGDYPDQKYLNQNR